MKIRNWITLGLIVSTSALTVACGGKDKGGDGDGDGGAGNGGDGDVDVSDLQDQIDDLEAQIADLQEQIDNASDVEIPDLEDELAAANDRLEQLETCANGGECTGVAQAVALSALTDSYCEWVFGCCSTDEAKATLGNAASDVEGCQDMFSQLLVRGGATPFTPGFGSGNFNAYEVGQLAARLQGGRVELDTDALEECAKVQGEAACFGVDPVEPAECSVGESSVCDTILKGLQEEGESCGYADDCVEGLYCSGAYDGYKDGVCLVEAKLDDNCQEEVDCTTSDGDLFCDESSGTCQARAAEGDDCVFTDPTFDKLPPSDLSLPCVPGFWCSLESSTCVATCDSLDAGDVCSSSVECGDSMYCDLTASPDQAYAGTCKNKLAAGASSDVPEACQSGSIFSDINDANYNAYNCVTYLIDCANRCDGVGGQDCSFDDFAGADCNSGSCKEAGEECRTKCDAQYDCGDGETCVDWVCYESVTSKAPCVVTEQCPADEFCEAGSCADRVATGDPDDAVDDCVDNVECASGSVCVNNDCRPYKGLGTDAYCSDWFHCTSGRCNLNAELAEDLNKCIAAADLGDEGEDCDMKDLTAGEINHDPCKSGLFCKRSAPNSTTDFGGECTKQIQPGEACDRSLDATVNQCVGNETCTQNPGTGAFACRVPYSEPDQNDKCVLGSNVFGISVAYGDFVTAAPL